MVMRRRRPSDASQGKAEVLVEALPWINEWAGSTFVVKYGGSAMEDAMLRAKVIEDVLLLKLMGVHVVLVHGGGKDISSLSDRLNLSVRFKDGLRVTDEDTMEVVQMVLVGKVNAELVQAINGYGDHAVGISGADGRTLRACQLDPELGRVGRVTEVNPDLALKVLDDGYIPVIAGVGFGEDGGPYNVNADFAASHIAQALGADKLFFLTDVDGLYADFDDKDSLIAGMGVGEARHLIDAGTLSKGMIPKVRSAIEAIEAGVGQVTILNGTVEHALLVETFTDEGIGTEISKYSRNPKEA